MILFCLELFVSIILSQQEETASIPSTRLFSVFHPLFKFSTKVATLGSFASLNKLVACLQERERIKTLLLQLNRSLQPCNSVFKAISGISKLVNMPRNQSQALVRAYDLCDWKMTLCVAVLDEGVPEEWDFVDDAGNGENSVSNQSAELEPKPEQPNYKLTTERTHEPAATQESLQKQIRLRDQMLATEAKRQSGNTEDLVQHDQMSAEVFATPRHGSPMNYPLDSPEHQKQYWHEEFLRAEGQKRFINQVESGCAGEEQQRDQMLAAVAATQCSPEHQKQYWHEEVLRAEGQKRFASQDDETDNPVSVWDLDTYTDDSDQSVGGESEIIEENEVLPTEYTPRLEIPEYTPQIFGLDSVTEEGSDCGTDDCSVWTEGANALDDDELDMMSRLPDGTTRYMFPLSEPEGPPG